MILEFQPDRGPTVLHHEPKAAVAIFVNDGDDQTGFLLHPGAARATAMAMLAAARKAEGETVHALPLQGIKLDVTHQPGQEPTGVLTLKINGANVAVTCDPMQLAELAAGFTAASNAVDRN
ncbi:hypothetical protein [Stakelama tenebrarum]|uniref:Uncharacterized protein n=1 Tax=Stakelama tenebrarum TaxID=2711215 RepID=A0A6G6Y5W0_9SPHN|nr:hypothetical protein [Sphingosinithalassobacter tenebrarum]QIG79966.1 hypothetical protein G5C33_09385 [Sphingosinithalassobacter tenebrarum]